MRLGSCSSFVEPRRQSAAVGGSVLEGASFAVGTQWLATALVLALAVMAWRNLDHLLVRQLITSMSALALIAVAIVAVGYWGVLYSRTTIDGLEIRQSGLLPRRVALADIGQLKLIRVRRLEWLVTPRLVVRARGSGLSTFYCADPNVLQAVEQLAYGDSPPPATKI